MSKFNRKKIDLEECAREHPDCVVDVDLNHVMYCIDHPMESDLIKAKALANQFDITLSEALQLITLKRLKEISSNLSSLRSHHRHFYF